jgi:hypothetical protein
LKLHEREALTAEACRRWREVDQKLVWGRFHAIMTSNAGWDYPQIWDEVRRQIPDYAQFCKVFEDLQTAVPDEPWSSKDIETNLDILAVKSICFRSGYYKEHICRRLKKYELKPQQSARLREIYSDYLTNRVYQRELADLARLMIRHSDSGTVRLLESLEREAGSERLKRRYRIFRTMILNQRKELR